jgi:lactoylglutathione lyase
MINKINAIVLFVRNFDACVKFYRDTLGFTVKHFNTGFLSFELAGQELALVDLATGSQIIGETALEPHKKGVQRVLLATFLDDTDEAYETLKARGVEFMKAPTTQHWGQRTAYFKDPEGNIWEIGHFLFEGKQREEEH